MNTIIVPPNNAEEFRQMLEDALEQLRELPYTQQVEASIDATLSLIQHMDGIIAKNGKVNLIELLLQHEQDIAPLKKGQVGFIKNEGGSESKPALKRKIGFALPDDGG